PWASEPAEPGPRLVVLSASADASRIDVVAGTLARRVDPPGGALQWLATDAGGRMYVTRLDGALVRATPDLTGIVRWESVLIARPAGSPPLSFAVPEPGGGRVAGLEADYGSGMTATLVVIGPGTETRRIPLGIEANGAAPAWLDATHVLVPGLLAARGSGTVIVDLASATVSAGPRAVRGAATGGGLVALVADDQRSITIGPSAGLLPPLDVTGVGSRIASEPEGIVECLALDTAGRSLAVVWTDRALVPSVVVRYDAASGWGEAARYPLGPAVSRASVAWLPQGLTMPP
ncbi:MAG TPA: hypothetical protein VEY67_00500, partial [Candidatus Dormibacteraeota bacterium]|nr:hypothetical protein [Candidatus Dormibacteraeota bacterium]